MRRDGALYQDTLWIGAYMCVASVVIFVFVARLCCYVVLACCFPEGPCSAVVVTIGVGVVLVSSRVFFFSFVCVFSSGFLLLLLLLFAA